MAQLSKTEVEVLTLLSQNPDGLSWPQIHHSYASTLERLEKRGFVLGTSQSARSPIIWTTTDAGRQALKAHQDSQAQ